MRHQSKPVTLKTCEEVTVTSSQVFDC